MIGDQLHGTDIWYYSENPAVTEFVVGHLPAKGAVSAFHCGLRICVSPVCVNLGPLLADPHILSC